MATNAEILAACPVHGRDDRKSARLAAERMAPEPSAEVVRSFSFAREILRSTTMKQAGASADLVDTSNPDQAPVFFLDGEAHKRKRTAIARFFTPKAIATKYSAVMERTTDELLSSMKTAGEARLDRISFQLAVAVAAEIVGLTNSNQAAMAARIGATLSAALQRPTRLGRSFGRLMQAYHALLFFYRDVRPAIAARRKARRDDVISHLLDEGYADRMILIECMTYAAAGMVTTREFIVMAAWHLFERDALRERFLAGDPDDQLAILEEILRLEPVAAMLLRRAEAGAQSPTSGPVAASTLFAIDIRGANTDEAFTGPCPYMIDPDRGKRMKVSGAFMSFGDGNHRCPGSQVALHETRIFLDRLFRLPGIRLAREPTIGWRDDLMGYELRDAIVACSQS